MRLLNYKKYTEKYKNEIDEIIFDTDNYDTPRYEIGLNDGYLFDNKSHFSTFSSISELKSLLNSIQKEGI